MALVLPYWAFLLAAALAADEVPRWIPGSTVKLFQLTGDLDRPRGAPTRSLTETRAGLFATDLGSSFEHDGKLVFLFGDSGGRPNARDAIAFADAKRAEDLVLDVALAGDGKFLPLTVPGIGQGAYEIPSYGISLGGAMHVVFTTDHSEARTMGRSVLATSRDDGKTFEVDGDVSTGHFINVALVAIDDGRRHGLPFDKAVLVFGSGDYRRSSVRLAVAPQDRFARIDSWRYFTGRADGRPRWSSRELEAAPLFDHSVVGELSVAYAPPLRRFVMLYNSSAAPRGIAMRIAESPLGPWSDAECVFDPWRDGGYGVFMHCDRKEKPLDVFHDAGKEQRWGGEYGPYLISRFIRSIGASESDAKRCELYFTMSTWNPYQVVLMRCEVGAAAPQAEPKVEPTLPGDDGWTVHGDFLRRFERKGKPHVTTWTDEKNAALGVAHFPLEAGADDEIVFTLHGGHARVVLTLDEKPPPPADETVADVKAFADSLLRGDFGAVLESVAGPDRNDLDHEIRFRLGRVANKKLRLWVIDALDSEWGFVSVSEFRFLRR